MTELIGELGDILDVIEAIVKAEGFPPTDIFAARVQKFKTRGGFDEKLFLEHVDEEEGI